MEHRGKEYVATVYVALDGSVFLIHGNFASFPFNQT